MLDSAWIQNNKKVRKRKSATGRMVLSLLLSFFLVVFFFLSHSYAQTSYPELTPEDLTDLSPEELADLAPENDYLAAAFMIFLFAVKSLIFIIPIPLLYIASGFLFDPVTAFLVNFLGMLVCTAVPYWIGRLSGAAFFQKMIKRYPKLQILDTFQSDNQWFVSFMARVIGFLPCDAVSMVFGVWKVNFLKYLSGTALGMLPGLIATTMVGLTITNPRSPEFILSVLFTVLVSLGSLIVWRQYQKRRKTNGEPSNVSPGLDFQHEEEEKDLVDHQQEEGN